MNIKNVVKDKMFGALICFASDEWEPVEWGKYIKYKLFSKEEVIKVGLNMLFYNESYETPYWEENEVLEGKQQVWKVYQEFIKHGNIVEDILFEECLREGITKYKTKEELNQNVRIIEVRIHWYNYAVIVSIPWEERDVAVVVCDVFDEAERYGYVIPEEEADPVEMNYEKSEYLLLTCKG